MIAKVDKLLESRISTNINPKIFEVRLPRFINPLFILMAAVMALCSGFYIRK
ncbi:hypothetical protein SMBr_42650 [Shewanella sp. M-Br]|nr:hypothetical protein SMBr_42650 [Shewanella sp. M-Br]